MQQFQIPGQIPPKFRKFLFCLLLLPVLEIIGFIAMGHWLGVMRTISLVILTSVVGAVVMNSPMSFSGKVRNPIEMLAAGTFSKLSGTLLLIPGFLTDLIGLLLLMPFVRRLIIKRFIGSQMQGFAAGGNIFDAEFSHEDKNNKNSANKDRDFLDSP